MRVPITRLRYTLQGIDPRHLEPEQHGITPTEGPLLISLLDSGDYYVHDGRHRTIRARHAGITHLDAELLT